ncbi:hypothetical protein AGMMS49941_07680 [Deferribacterales bacterium]|nr:hypothetical protein AGMMS49941_07680 [Deferribacterales bacterium]
MLRPFLFFFIFTLLIQLFVSADGHWSRPTNETTIYAVFYVSKFAMVVGFSLLFVRTTPASDIVKIFYLLFQPLKYFRISPLDAAFSVLVTLRFIPLLFNEGGKIMDVQRLKGILPLKGESLPLLRTVRVVSALITPLLVRTFRYASQIAIALRYRTGNPSFFALAAFNWFDFVAISIAIVISAGAKLALS